MDDRRVPLLDTSAASVAAADGLGCLRFDACGAAAAAPGWRGHGALLPVLPGAAPILRVPAHLLTMRNAGCSSLKSTSHPVHTHACCHMSPARWRSCIAGTSASDPCTVSAHGLLCTTQPLVPAAVMLWAWAVSVGQFERRVIRYEVCFSQRDQQRLLPARALYNVSVAFSLERVLTDCVTAFCACQLPPSDDATGNHNLDAEGHAQYESCLAHPQRQAEAQVARVVSCHQEGGAPFADGRASDCAGRWLRW